MTSKCGILFMACLTFVAFSVLYISVGVVIPFSWWDPYDIALHSMGFLVSSFTLGIALKNVLTHKIEKQICSLVYTQGLSLATVFHAVSVWTTYRFDTNLTVYEPDNSPFIVVPISAVLVFAVLIIHLRNIPAQYSTKHISIVFSISLAFVLFAFWAFNRPVESTSIGILLVHLTAYFTKFIIKGTYRYYFATVVFIVWLVAVYLRASYVFVRGGGF